jgi:N-methylhydantoinase B
MIAQAGGRVSLPSKVPYQKAKQGDRLLAYGPSGGGYGDPFQRDPGAVLDNVLDGLFSPAVAREHYGVVIAGGTLDRAATEALRKAHRAG